ncbi:MAG: amino acid decarboxylase, partial [Lewinella sp.]|nr:amino acid decarboxylase [Lewinella sp.]
KYDIWLHLDAAYGGYFILLDRFRYLLNGVSKVDSAVLDPHKSLFLPYGTGMVLVREGHKLVRSFHHSATYLQDIDDDLVDVSPADVSLELTRHFRGLRMWLPLQLHGIEPFKNALEEKILLTRYFYEEVQKIGFEVGPFPELSICIYRYIPGTDADANAFNERLLKTILKVGRFFISSTTIDSTYWLHLAVLTYHTHLDTIREYLDHLRKMVAKLNGENDLVN